MSENVESKVVEQKERTVQVNEFVARGKVSFIGRGNYGSRILVLFVKDRRSDLRLSITLEQNAGRGINKNDNVIVRGYVKAFEYHNDALNKDSSIMYLVATSVQHDKKALEKRFAKPDFGLYYRKGTFDAFVAGKVVSVKPPKEGGVMGILTIETCGGGHDLRPARIPLVYHTGGRLPTYDYMYGDEVAVWISAYTPERKDKEGKAFYPLSLGVEDIGFMKKITRDDELGEQDPYGISTKRHDITEGFTDSNAIEGAAFADDEDLMHS